MVGQLMAFAHDADRYHATPNATMLGGPTRLVAVVSGHELLVSGLP